MFESSYKFNPEFEERHNPFQPHTNLVKKLVRRGILMYHHEFHYNDPPNNIDTVYNVKGDHVIIYNPIGIYVSTRISQISEVFTKDGVFIAYNLLTYENADYIWNLNPNIYLAVYEQLSTKIFNQEPEYMR
jgi:hypothetical protein